MNFISTFPTDPYPKGWFVIAFSDELPKGGVLSLAYFGKQLVLYRGETGSVHLLEWPEIPAAGVPTEDWQRLRELRTQVTEAIEPLRRDKVLGSSLEAEVTVPAGLVPAARSPIATQPENSGFEPWPRAAPRPPSA